MLTKVDHSNKFSSTLTLSNNQALGWQTERERIMASGCMVVIMNTINFYNLLYLSEKLRQCPSEDERGELLKTILKSSTHTCRTALAATHKSGWRVRFFRLGDFRIDF